MRAVKKEKETLFFRFLSPLSRSLFCCSGRASGDLFSAAFFALPRRYKSPPPICAPACELAKEPMHSRGTNRFAKRETHSKPTSSPKMIQYSVDPLLFVPRSNSWLINTWQKKEAQIQVRICPARCLLVVASPQQVGQINPRVVNI